MLHDIKGKLARLLATENLIVEHKKVETASFNVDTRVLTLPIWKIASNNVYDLLVSHEVGHALFTPNRDWINEDDYRYVPHQFVNIIEDVRIEKLMKRKYAGLSKTFYRGYSELQQEDFFCLGDEDVDNYSFPDRINLYYKIGSFLKINFTAEEQEIVNLLKDSETFDQVLDASVILMNFLKKKQEEKEVDLPTISQGSSGDESEGSPNPQDTTPVPSETPQDRQEGDSDGDQQEDTDKQQSPQGGSTNNEFETRTADSLEESLKDLVDNFSFETTYVEVPKVNLDSVIAPCSEIRDLLTTFWNLNTQKRNEDRSEYNLTPINIFEQVDQDYKSFKKSSSKEVNYLVKEFECRKAADAYSRTSVARTGVLDCTKLHTYKYNEDLFRKITITPDGKNHGLVFVLDWSGSMERVLLDTVKQLMNLVWFCKKVSIPFDVYAFTNEWFHTRDGVLPPEKCNRIENQLHVQPEFGMLNLLSSSSSNFETDMLYLYRMAHYFSTWRSGNEYSVPWRLNLSGTPLNEAIISLYQIIPNFKKTTGAQKVQCIVFTDGESQAIPRNRIVKRDWEKGPYMGTAHLGRNCFLRNRKTGNMTSIDGNFQEFTKVLLEDLGDTFQDVNLIGFRILESRDAGAFIRRYILNPTVAEKVQSHWRKERCFTIEEAGYAKYFGLSAVTLAQESDFEVAEDATKTQIRNAFKKSLTSKKMNKKILNEFVGLIA